MNTKNNRKKSVIAALGAVTAAVAAPALLFTGAGAAQAATLVTPESNALGVTVSVLSDTQWGGCNYTAIPQGGWSPGQPLPLYGVPFFLQKGLNHQMWFPGIQTGTTWDVTVKCDNNGGTTEVMQAVY
jgi:hypothetical protein